MNFGNAFQFSSRYRRIGRASSWLAAIGLAAISFGAAAANVDFDVTNRTDHDIVAMWVSPYGMDSWGPGIRPGYLAAAGGFTRINFQVGTEVSHTCLYDFRVKFYGGQVRYWRALNLCTMRGISIDVVNGEVTGVTY